MGSAPKPPDPYKTASAQGAANREAAVASSIIGNVNENNPYGSVNYKRLADEYTTDASGKQVAVPRYERNVTLSPEQQELLNYQNQMQSNLGQLGVSQSNRLQGLLGTNLDTEGLPAWQSYQQAKPMQTTFDDVGGVKRSIGDLGGIQNSFGANNPLAMTVGDGGQIRQDQGATDRNAIEQAMLSRYREQSGKDRAAEDARLAAQGLTQGSGRYGSVAQQRGQQDVDAYNQAYLASGAESRAAQDAYNQAQNQRFTQGVTQGQFQNAAQSQAFQEEMARAGFANEAQQQDFLQKAAQGQFENEAQAQAYQQAMDRANFANAGNQQDWTNANAYTDASNALRGQQLQERQQIRNAPINEISALMGGSQVTVPEFQAYNSPSVNAAPIGDYINQNYQARLSNYQNKMSGLFGLGGGMLNMFKFGA
ncbi:MAG TPA: hypothetical protein VLC08_16525 [Chitinolyticbacter sp.]|nr:hypothetical protein [Chitinolyticbacter sp.]